MSSLNSILARWSRRKQAAALTSSSERFAKDGTIPDPASPQPGATRGVDPKLEELRLPPIDTITAETDVRGFLDPRAPLELSRAALRRAWATDPKICGFIGPADYDWDFNQPGAMAGFEPLEVTDDLRRIAAAMVGRALVNDHETGELNRGHQDPSQHPVQTQSRRPTPQDPQNAPTEKDCPDPPKLLASTTGSAREERHLRTTPPLSQQSRSIVRRQHGGALPK